MDSISALVGMSGGVDSSVAAYLLARDGTCAGATMRLCDPGQGDAMQQVRDAQGVAARLGIPFYTFDLREDFRRLVIDSFVSDYECGLTPNPCIVCNRHLKFDLFLRSAQELGCTHVATGHYARIIRGTDGRMLLCKPVDAARDQTYFLYSLTQAQLAHTLFPLGGLTKPQVRQIAEEQGFLNARKKDSQDICFVPDGDYASFIRRYTGRTYPAGDFLDTQGHVVGRHAGAIGYTIGQRKGLGLAMGQPVYVCRKDMAANTVTVGGNDALMRRALLADEWNFIAQDAPQTPIRCKAKARSRMAEQPATVIPQEDGVYRVVFDEPQRALTPGQAVVLYDGETVLGGGVIRRVAEE